MRAGKTGHVAHEQPRVLVLLHNGSITLHPFHYRPFQKVPQVRTVNSISGHRRKGSCGWRGFPLKQRRRPSMLSDTAIWNSLRRSKQLTLIAGPCVIETEALCFKVATALRKTCGKLGVNYIFKASFDKANRSSGQSFRGPGAEAGLEVLARVRARLGVPVLTDVHTEEQACAAADAVDVLQIPAFLCRQTDLIAAAVRTGKIVNLKKGQFLSPAEMGQVVAKARSSGARKILVT